MAIQQTVGASITLVGDGVSTVFKYHLNQLFSLNLNGPQLINPNASLSNVTAFIVSGFSGLVVTGSSSGGEMILTFSAAPPMNAVGLVDLSLLFDSQ